MTVTTIYLKKEINPEYYNIGEEHKVLMDKWNKQNNAIHSLKTPKLFIWKAKKELVQLKKDGKELSDEYIAWNKTATEFLLNPKFYYDKEQKKRSLVYKNFTKSLKFIIEKMNDNMVMIANNFNLRSSEYREQRNFIIAITAFSFGFIGLIFTVYLFFFTPKVDTVTINKTIPKQIENLDNNVNLNSNKIDALVSSNKKVIQELKKIQRLHKVSTDSSSINDLIDDELHSAKDIIDE